MSERQVVFLGGNGHCAARLAAARTVLEKQSVHLLDVPYPGFEGRSSVPDLEDFLRSVSAALARSLGSGNGSLAYATGIGGLIAVCLRARGEILDIPLLLQAPVLWGLDHRLMPRLMRWPMIPALAAGLFATRGFQRRFVRRHFTTPPSAEMKAAFFDGYARCAAFPDMFRWFTPRVLRRLERQLAERPAALERMTVWWGGRDRVVTPRELRWTAQALGTTWPLTVFPDWGHYPMIDAPEAWGRALAQDATAPS